MRPSPRGRVLIVESSRVLSSRIARRLDTDLGLESRIVSTYREADDALRDGAAWRAVITGLTVSDAPDGAVVRLATEAGVPVVVLSSNLDEDTRERVMALEPVDYVLKDGPAALEHVVRLIAALERNARMGVLLVDDSTVTRTLVRRSLETQRFTVTEASSGAEALRLLAVTPGVRMVITDFNMPGMDGFELLGEIRKTASMGELAVIGLSTRGNPQLAVRFLKGGANDFLAKPFEREELLWRVNQNMELLDQLEQVREASVRDFLTGLLNRRAFFNRASRRVEEANRGGAPVCAVVLDIDRFKQVNDGYGHAAGDEAIRQVARHLVAHAGPQDIIARLGGDEFCVLTVGTSPEQVGEQFNAVTRTVAETPVLAEGQEFHISISTGITGRVADTLDSMLADADSALYEAKRGGRGRVQLMA